jgi:hypothetical protein
MILVILKSCPTKYPPSLGDPLGEEERPRHCGKPSGSFTPSATFVIKTPCPLCSGSSTTFTLRRRRLIEPGMRHEQIPPAAKEWVSASGPSQQSCSPLRQERGADAPSRQGGRRLLGAPDLFHEQLNAGLDSHCKAGDDPAKAAAVSAHHLGQDDRRQPQTVRPLRPNALRSTPSASVRELIGEASHRPARC